MLAREGGRFRVATESGEVVAVLRGKAKRDARDRVVVGDRVRLDPGGADKVLGIAAVEPRRNVLTRRTPDGRGERPVAANLDHVFVVTAPLHPAPVPEHLDRLCTIAEANDIPVAVVINKVDLAPAGALAERMRRAGYGVFEVSARTGQGLDPLFDLFRGRQSLLAGASGVGKSSLLNRLQPGLGLRTREVSARIGRGRNTTVAGRMIPLEGSGPGWIVDTPGFGEVGLWGIEPRELARCFPEFRGPLERCRFPDCRHRAEPACAVREAVGAGAIAGDRYESYLALLDELLAAPREWE